MKNTTVFLLATLCPFQMARSTIDPQNNVTIIPPTLLIVRPIWTGMELIDRQQIFFEFKTKLNLDLTRNSFLIVFLNYLK